MMSQHLSEADIQQYVLERPVCEDGIAHHVEQCEDCKARAAVYEMLFSGIRQEPGPAFDFDLSALVLGQLPGVAPAHLPGLAPAQLPRKKPRFAPGIVFAYLLGLSMCAAIGIPLYLFGKDLLRLFAGILPMAKYLIFITAITIFIFQIIEMFKKYRGQMKALNYQGQHLQH
jgi:hypothetical protein